MDFRKQQNRSLHLVEPIFFDPKKESSETVSREVLGVSTKVLFVVYHFQPIHGLPVELFLNGDMGHCGSWTGSMPMLLPGRKPNHIPGSNFLDRSPPFLSPATSGGDDDGLT